MNILFTGLNGLTGSYLAKLILNSEILNQNYYASISRNYKYDYLTLASRSLVNKEYLGDCRDMDFLENTIKAFKPDLIVHLAQINLTKYLLEVLNKIEYKGRIFVLGTTAVFSKFKICSGPYIEAEKLLENSSFEFQVLRSSLIYGSCFDKNFHKLFDAINNGKLIPLPGNGKSLYQPIYYKDLSKVIFHLLFTHSFKYGFYNCPGQETLSLKEIVELIGEVLNKRPLVVNVPLNLTYKLLSIAEKLTLKSKIKIPINSEQILRLNEDKVCNSSLAILKNDINLLSLKEGIYEQANEKYFNFNKN